MKSDIIEQAEMLLVGFDFFGDPFRSHGGWSAENEIGRLWQRWMAYLERAGERIRHVTTHAVHYEIHIHHAETPHTGEFEVFVGVGVAQLEALPPEVVAKQLAAGRYAVFTLRGEEITGDWPWLLDSAWLPTLGVRRDTTFSIQRYDARFKGTDDIASSELDVLIPLLA